MSRSRYGQYCPVAQAAGNCWGSWTLLIIRDMLTGTTNFNDLERGLPGFQGQLLARRLRVLQEAGQRTSTRRGARRRNIT